MGGSGRQYVYQVTDNVAKNHNADNDQFETNGDGRHKRRTLLHDVPSPLVTHVCSIHTIGIVNIIVTFHEE